jgi:hypothetical protein
MERLKEASAPRLPPAVAEKSVESPPDSGSGKDSQPSDRTIDPPPTKKEIPADVKDDQGGENDE